MRIGQAVQVVAIGLLLARAGHLLLREPCLGVADNLDYWRVARPAGVMVEAQPRQGSYVVCRYRCGETDLDSSFSSAALLVVAARPLGPLLGVPTGELDLRQLGLLYGLLTAGVLLVAWRAGLPGLQVFLFGWVLVDPGFLLFFNSLYADPALILGLVAALCWIGLPGAHPETAIDRPRPWRHWAMLLLAAAVGGFAKMQDSTFPLTLGLACTAAWALRRRRAGRGEALFLAVLGVLAVLAPLHFAVGSGPRFLDANNYNAIWGGIVRVSSAPESALAELGIPELDRDRPAQDYFAAGVRDSDPILVPVRRLSRLRLAGLYMRDPGALARSGALIEDGLWRLRTHPRGTVTREAAARGQDGVHPPEQFARWRALLLGWLPAGRTWIILLAVAGWLARQIWRRRSSPWANQALLLMLWLGSQLVVVVLGEGFVNLHQHLLGARIAFDLLLAMLAAAGLSRVAGAAVRWWQGRESIASSDSSSPDGRHR